MSCCSFENFVNKSFRNYDNMTGIEFDPQKSEANELKHGAPLSLARAIDWSAVWCAPDDRHDYGELREIGYAPIDGHLFCVVFTQRGDKFGVISLRKANSREVKRYVQQV
jgi:uncharacterized protein